MNSAPVPPLGPLAGALSEPLGPLAGALSEPLSGMRVLSAWRLDLPAVVVLALLGAAYLLGIVRLRRRGERWPVWPSVAFLVLGLGTAVLATMSCVGVYDRVLFWPRAVQFTVLLALCPLLLAMGEPLELARRCLDASGRRRLEAALGSRALRILSFPLVGAVLGVVALLVLYLSPLFALTLRSSLAQHLVWLGLVLIGVTFFVPELDRGDDLLPSWCGYPARLAFSMVDGLLDALPGIVVMTMHGTIAAAFYARLGRTWGPSLHWDQTIGGALMLVLAEAIALPFLVVLFLRWAQDDERAGRAADLRLASHALAATGPSGSLPVVEVTGAGVTGVAPTAEDAPLATRPWWETDPGPLAQRHGWQRPADGRSET